jgi:dTDP-4-amino-4,6-dideoxygalactose transaminase
MEATRSRVKGKVDDLAIAGGSPAFAEQVHVGRPNIGDRSELRRRFEEILDRRWLTNSGPCVNELQKRLAELLGVKHVICMANGTVALEIAIRAAGLKGEVIVPSFTFIATAHALQWQEITPVFCDVDLETHTLDPAQIERLITPRTTGIIGVHLWGRPCEIEALTTIARERRLELLFDAAHAFGCSYKGRRIGGFGLAEVFSFHATKFFNTFEGGAVATNDDALASRIRLMTNFGFVGYDKVNYIGTNGKMTEFSAAMGLTGLESLDDFVAVNRANHELYRRELDRVPGIRMIRFDESEECNYQYAVLEIDSARTGLSRDELLAVLHAENVLARRYFHPGCHAMEPYRSYFPNARLLLPNTEELARRVLCLPTGSAIDAESAHQICAIIHLSIEGRDELRQRGVDFGRLHSPPYGETGVGESP